MNVTSPGSMIKLQGPQVWELHALVCGSPDFKLKLKLPGGNRAQRAQQLAWVATGRRTALNPVWRADGCASDDRALTPALFLSRHFS